MTVMSSVTLACGRVLVREGAGKNVYLRWAWRYWGLNIPEQLELPTDSGCSDTPGPRERWNYDLDNEEIPICETHLQVENPMPSIPLQRGSLSLAYISVDGHYTLEDRSCIHKQCRWSSCSETLKRLLALLKLKGTVKIVYYSRRAL
jgi:hypothetical protein